MELRDQNVLVTGGNGFIGKALAKSLASSYRRWISFDNLLPQVHDSMPPDVDLPKNFELIKGDVTDYSTLKSVLDDVRPSVVIHLAAETGTGQSLYESRKHVSVNDLGTANLIDGLSDLQIKPEHILLASSRAIYGEGLWVRNGQYFYPEIRSKEMMEQGFWDFKDSQPTPMFGESVRPNPVSIYGATKLSQENLLRAWAASNGVGLTILRLQNVYGPGQAPGNPYTGIVTLFINIARSGSVIPVYEDGEILRDFVFISDVIDAFCAAMKRNDGTSYGTFDVGSGHKTSIHSLAKLISAIFGVEAPRVTGQFRFGDVRSAWADISRTAEVLGWEPKIDLQNGINALVSWIESQVSVEKSKHI